MLNNPRHEGFAQELAKGKTASDAYRTIFGKDNRRYASELGQRPDISGRVQDILSERAEIDREATEKAAEALSLDKQWVLARLKENADRAMQAVEVKGPQGASTGEYKYDGSVANRALELIGKELGMFIDRSEARNFNFGISGEPITEDEWAARHGEATTH